MSDLECVRCGKPGKQLDRPPLKNELGERILGSICTTCWSEWLAYQQALINHYGLDVRDADARQFLTQNMEAYLFDSGETEDIDTSQEGNISW